MNVSKKLESHEKAGEDASIAHFADSHVGIIKHVESLGNLPALLEPAAEARRIAASALAFFRAAVFRHHEEEEQELFSAVRQSAAPGEERNRVDSVVQRLVEEHRSLETLWKRLEPKLKKVAKGQDTDVDIQAIEALVAGYKAHAAFEEEVFLPLSAEILGRNDDHLAALGMSLHMRYASPKIKGYI